MAIQIYALQTFTATDGTSCFRNNTYTVAESAANVAVQRGQAQISEIKKDAYAAFGQLGIPTSFSTRILTNSDNGLTLLPSDSSQTATVPVGLAEGFGCAFNSNLTVSAASGVTVTDKRVSGATNPICAIINVGNDTYEVWGSKT